MLPLLTALVKSIEEERKRRQQRAAKEEVRKALEDLARAAIIK